MTVDEYEFMQDAATAQQTAQTAAISMLLDALRDAECMLGLLEKRVKLAVSHQAEQDIYACMFGSAYGTAVASMIASLDDGARRLRRELGRLGVRLTPRDDGPARIITYSGQVADISQWRGPKAS